MDKKTIKKIKSVCESLGWNVSQDEDGEITGVETWSDSGEDVCIEGSDTEDLLDNLSSKVGEFDVDEYVDMYASSRGQNGVPSTYQGLIEAGEQYFDLIDLLNTSLLEFH